MRRQVGTRHTFGTGRRKEAKLAEAALEIRIGGGDGRKGGCYGHQHLELDLCVEIGIGELFSLWISSQ